MQKTMINPLLLLLLSKENDAFKLWDGLCKKIWSLYNSRPFYFFIKVKNVIRIFDFIKKINPSLTQVCK